LSSDDDVDRWTDQVTWDAVLKNIRIVISPHAVLLDALSHGFVTMQRLAICVFDEGMKAIRHFVFHLTEPQHIIPRKNIPPMQSCSISISLQKIEVYLSLIYWA